MGGLKAMKNLAGSSNQGWRDNTSLTRPRTAALGGAPWGPLCTGLESRQSAGGSMAESRGGPKGGGGFGPLIE